MPALAHRLPCLHELYLSDCYPCDSEAPSASTTIVSFPQLHTLDISRGSDLGVELRIPELVDFELKESDYMRLESFFPPPPGPAYHQLEYLTVESYDSDGDLIAILRRHPTIVELRLGQEASTPSMCNALGSGLCPALRVLKIETSEDDSPRPIMDMIQSRVDAAAREEDITPLWDFEEGEYVTVFCNEGDKDEIEWMWAHLRKFDGWGPRPK